MQNGFRAYSDSPAQNRSMHTLRSFGFRSLLLLGSTAFIAGCATTPGNYYGSSMAHSSAPRGTVIYQDPYYPYGPYGYDYAPGYGYGYGRPYYPYSPPRVIEVRPTRPVPPPRDHQRPPRDRDRDHNRPPRGDHQPRPDRPDRPTRPDRPDRPQWPPRAEQPPRPPRAERPPTRPPQQQPEPPRPPAANDGRIPRAIFGVR